MATVTKVLELQDDDDNVPFVETNLVNVAPPRPADEICKSPPYNVKEEGNNNPLIDKLILNEDGKLLKNYLKWEGFGDHHIQVYDHWVCQTSYNNITSRILQFRDGRVVTFENLRVFPPSYTRDGKVYLLTPKLAREQGVTYGSDWYVDVVIREGGPTGQIKERKNGICIGMIPVMLKSQNCILRGKSERQLALLGEEPNDPGGYFIVGHGGNAAEKVCLLQEQLAVDKIYLMNMDNKGAPVARMTANTKRGTALIELALDKKTRSVLKIRFPSMRGSKPGEKYKSLNVLRIFRIFKIEDVATIKAMIARFIKPERVKKSMLKLNRNIVDFSLFPNDIDIMAAKIAKSRSTDDKQGGPKFSPEDKIKEVNNVLNTDLFPHLNNLPGPDMETLAERETRITNAKINLLAIMIARFLEHLAGYRELDDRDSWSNKRVEGAGRMMEQLFRNAWRKVLGLVQSSMDAGTVKDLSSVVEKLRTSIITDTFHDSFITSNWGVKGTQMKNNVAQTLVRDSVVATFAHINTVDVGISRTDRQPSLRLIQNSQWGFICPVSTPEGENVGILKNLAITAKVSLERNDEPIIRLLIGDAGRQIPSRVSSYPTETWTDKLIVAGKFLGWCQGTETKNFLIQLRRSQQVPIDMSVIKEDDWIYVDVGPSRLVRPLLVVDEDQQLLIDKWNLRNASPQELIARGAMEYISSWEQEYIKLAVVRDEITNRLESIRDADRLYNEAMINFTRVQSGETIQIDETTILTLEMAKDALTNAEFNLTKAKSNQPYTHCELDPTAELGVAAALIPWPNHNQAPRNTYQVSMGKQALGIFHSNHANRFDGKTKILGFPSRPMVETEMYDIIGLNTRGPGSNCAIAFLAYSFNEEDSFVVKKEFLENGGFRLIRYLTYKTIVKDAGEVNEKLKRPEPGPGEPEGRYKYIQQGNRDDPGNGLPMIGAPMRPGDCVIGKIQFSPRTKEFSNESVFLRVGDEGVVDKVLVTSDNKTTVVTVKLRIMRVPQEGDKFSPRNAQKGTIGLVVSDIDLPCTADGIVPDFIMNTQSLPSRMTMAYLMEMHASKHGAYAGVHINGGAFKPYNMNEYRQTLKQYGRDEFGYEKMRSGTSGKQLIADVNMGPVFVQALKHHVRDKVQVRSIGQVKPMTRQPPKGRGNRGGLRFGEMERDAAISHGASSFLRERLMKVSDAYPTVFCKNCGIFAVNDGTTGMYKPCKICKQSNFGTVTIPYAYKLLIHLLAAIGINLRPELLSYEEYAEKIFKNKGTIEGASIEDIKRQLGEADEGLDEMDEQEEETDFADVYDE